MINITSAVLMYCTTKTFNSLEDSYLDFDLCASNSANSMISMTILVKMNWIIPLIMIITVTIRNGQPMIFA